MNNTPDLIDVLEKHFYVEYSEAVGKLWVYEKETDERPMFILTDSAWYIGGDENNCWVVANISSALEDGTKIHTDELIKLVEANKIIKH